EGASPELAALVVDADCPTVLDAARLGIRGRKPEPRLGIEASQRWQRLAVVVEAVELGQRAPLPERERIQGRRRRWLVEHGKRREADGRGPLRIELDRARRRVEDEARVRDVRDGERADPALGA